MTKLFFLEHIVYHGGTICTVEQLPSWLRSKEYEWFLNDYVLTLEIGKSVETDFHTIKRIA